MTMSRGKPEQLWLPVHPLLLLRLAALTLMLVILTRTQADPDLWGHVLFGRDIVAARSVPRIDQYAFTTTGPGSITSGSPKS